MSQFHEKEKRNDAQTTFPTTSFRIVDIPLIYNVLLDECRTHTTSILRRAILNSYCGNNRESLLVL